MTLREDVTFDSLSAVKEGIRQWLGPDSGPEDSAPRHGAARDALISVWIHTLAGELSDLRVRSQIHALLSDLSQQSREPFAD